MEAKCVVLFPGAAQQSTTLLPGVGARRYAGKHEACTWIMIVGEKSTKVHKTPHMINLSVILDPHTTVHISTEN